MCMTQSAFVVKENSWFGPLLPHRGALIPLCHRYTPLPTVSPRSLRFSKIKHFIPPRIGLQILHHSDHFLTGNSLCQCLTENLVSKEQNIGSTKSSHKCFIIQPIFLHLVHEDIMGDFIKCLAEIFAWIYHVKKEIGLCHIKNTHTITRETTFTHYNKYCKKKIVFFIFHQSDIILSSIPYSIWKQEK